jgi:hypothetical protein
VRNLRLSGAPFLNNHSSLTEPLITGQLGDEKFSVGRYRLLNGDRESLEIHRPLTFARSSLPRSLPHIILKNRRSRIIPLVGARRANATLMLEGDYADNYTLYCPKDYEADALYIFTPEVIAAIYDFAADAELELVDDNLYLYTGSRTPFVKPDKLTEMLDLLMKLDARFDKRAKRYKDAGASLDYAVGQTPAGAISQRARRLKLKHLSVLGLTITTSWALFILWQFLNAWEIHPFIDWWQWLVDWLSELFRN